MRLEAYLVAEMLQHMERNGAALRPCTVDIATAITREEYPAAREASAGLQRALEAFVASTKLLRDHVVAHDGMGPLGDCHGELTLRARALVLDAQIQQLCEALREPTAQARARGWFVGRFRCVDDVALFVAERLATLHALWTPFRQGCPQPEGVTESDRLSLYRATVRVAQRALRALRDDPDLARVLAAGTAARDLSAVQQACTQINSVLNASIDPEVSHWAVRTSDRLSCDDGPPERR